MIRILEKSDNGHNKIEINSLVESNNFTKLPLTESNDTVELNEKKVKCISAYSVPISRPDKENLNGRVYEKALWEKVIKEQKKVWDGAFGLCDHPDKDGSVKDAFCVWKNLRFNEDRSLVKADIYLFGKWGQHAEDAIQAGGKLGFSTVGWGDFKEDNRTIDENTYFIERPADWVLNPSYEVFGVASDKINSESKNEDNNQEPLKEDYEQKKNKKMEKVRMTIEERDFRHKISRFLEDAKAVKNIEERLLVYQDILSYFDGIDFAEDLQKEVTDLVENTEEEITNLVEKGTKFDQTSASKEELENTVNELNDNLKKVEDELLKVSKFYEEATKQLDAQKEYTNNMRVFYKKQSARMNTMIAPSKYNELLVYSENLEKTLEEQKSITREVSEKYTELKSQVDAEKLRESMEAKRIQDEKDKETFLKKRRDELEEIKKKDEERKRIEHEKIVGMDFSNSAEVKEYYNDLLSENANVYLIEDKILSCKTLYEAQMAYMKYRSLVEDGIDKFTSRFDGEPIFEESEVSKKILDEERKRSHVFNGKNIRYDSESIF